MNMQLHENKFGEVDGNKVFVHKYINKKNRWFVKAMNLQRLILPFVPPFYCNWKVWKACSNFWEFCALSRWQNTRIHAPYIQNPSRFCRFNIV